MTRTGLVALTVSAFALGAQAQIAPDAPAPGDSRVVRLSEEGPVVTGETAPRRDETETGTAGAAGSGPTAPVMRDTDRLVMEPLVARIGTDVGKLHETQVVETEIVETTEGVDEAPIVRRKTMMIEENGTIRFLDGDQEPGTGPRMRVEVRVMKSADGNDAVTIDATGGTVTESATPDGSTRLTPADGGSATLITITKD